MNTRRVFLRWVALGFGALAGTIPALQRWQGSVARSQTTPQFKPVAKVADLKEGQLLVEKALGDKSVLLFQDPTDAKKILAVDAACTHRGCDVALKGSELVCPCHNSKFALNGNVTNGPAKDPLTVYEAKLEGDAILLATPKA
ncbi:MAG: Rieske (2Fe-2S) protein [Cyanobacteriota bacterium]|nr:Rieske (2Fe-2S) protein [Cyanobacteriota bacterium]